MINCEDMVRAFQSMHVYRIVKVVDIDLFM